MYLYKIEPISFRLYCRRRVFFYFGFLQEPKSPIKIGETDQKSWKEKRMKFLSKLALSLEPYVPGEQPKDKNISS